MPTAIMTRGTNGRPLVSGFDLSNLTVMPSGEPIEHWTRQVSLDVEEITLQKVLDSDKHLKYNLLANIMINDEKVSPSSVVSLYRSGKVKEIRHNKNCYRAYDKMYLGTRKLRSESL